jgi:alpha-mannosidase
MDSAPPGVVLSALKQAEDRSSIVVRVFNPNDDALTATLALDVPPAQAFAVNFLEERQDKLLPADGVVTIAIAPRQIKTIELAL